MISKFDAKSKGICTVEVLAGSSNKLSSIAQAIRTVDPKLVNELGEIDMEALHTLVDGRTSDVSVTAYELQFVGKNVAIHEADTPRTHELKPILNLSSNFEETRNVLIIGDNLHALKILYQNYHNSIKMIYIDPPYNRNTDRFVYADQFRQSEADIQELLNLDEDEIQFVFNIFQSQTHSGWLAFMYSRLKLARELLSDEGVIFVSIDDIEMPDLYVVLRELFGEEQVDCLVWRKSGDGRDGKMKNTTTFRKDHEYVLVAFKNKKRLNKSLDYPNWKNQYPNPDNDPRGPYKAGSISRKEEESNPESPNFYEVTSPTGKVFRRQFDVSSTKFEELNNDGRISWGKTGDAVPAIKIFEGEKRETNTSSILLNDGTTTEGSKELNDLLGCDGVGQEFRPKPVQLIKKLIQIGTNAKSNDIVLDFFAGTGTTGEACVRMNAEDGGTRKFILVQLDEEIDKVNSPSTFQFCTSRKLPKIIPSITQRRLQRSARTVSKTSEAQIHGTDVGVRVFEMVQKPHISQDPNSELPGLEIEHRRNTPLDTLINLIAASGKTLDVPIECVVNDKVFRVEGDFYVVSPITHEEFESMKGNQIFVDGWGDFDIQTFVHASVADDIIVVY